MNRRAGTVYKPFKRWQVRELSEKGNEKSGLSGKRTRRVMNERGQVGEP